MEIERLRRRLNEMDAINFSVSLGSDNMATSEQIAGEVNRSMDRIEAGDFEIIEEFED